jgi:hypothetical protein
MFSDGERAYLQEMRALATDLQGREVLIGLTFEETEFYLAHSREMMSSDELGPNHHHEDGERYLALHEKQERARFEVLAAENQKRVDKPTVN